MKIIKLLLTLFLAIQVTPAVARELAWWEHPTHQKIALGLGVAATASYLIYARYARAAERTIALEQLEKKQKYADANRNDLQDNRWIIFDLGDVLLTTNSFAALREIGIGTFLAYAKENVGNIFDLQTRFRHEALFPFLNSLTPRDPNEAQARDAHGNLLPQIMCNWLKGSCSNEQAAKLIDDGIARYAFNSEAEKRLVHATASMMFTPEKLINTFDLSSGAVELVQHYTERGIRCAVLSNMEPQVTRLLQAKFPEFFALFDLVIASGEHNAIKPALPIYKKLLSTIQTDPAHCAFVDDREENITTADNLGIYGIICPSRKTWIPWKKAPDLMHVQEMLDYWLDRRPQLVAARA